MKKVLVVGMLAVALIFSFSQTSEYYVTEEVKPLGFGYIHG